MTTRDPAFLLADRPVGLDDDALWRDGPTRHHLDRIATRIVASLDGTPLHRASMTFAVHGPWGTGKSSALRMIRERCAQLAEESGCGDKVHFCHYLAPMYQDLEVRTTLAIRMLGGLAGGTLAAVERYLPEVLGMHGPESVLHAGPPSQRSGAAAQALARIASSLSGLIDFDHILDTALDGSALVVFVDDLDRCRSEFVGRILDTIQQFSEVRGLYFVLGVDAEHLRRTMRERSVDAGAEEYSLEKYVQHSVHLPDLERELQTRYVLELVASYQEQRALYQTLQQGMSLLELGLRQRTPRSIKRVLNRLGAESAQMHGNDLRQRLLLVKSHLLRLGWPAFYDRCFPSTNHVERKAAFDWLEQEAHQFVVHHNFPLLRFKIAQHAQLAEPDLVTPELARFLGTDPLWSSGATATGDNAAAAGVKPHIQPELEEIEDAAFSEDLFQIYLRVRVARTQEDPALRTLIARALGLIELRRAQLGPEHCPTVGNIALLAEGNDDAAATRLYEIATQLDPRHVNNTANFAEYLLKTKPEGYQARAVALLRGVEPHALEDERARIAMLLARLRLVGGEDGDPAGAEDTTEDAIAGLMQRFHAAPREASFIRVMTALDSIKDYPRARQVAREFYEHASTGEERYTALRGMADMLAPSDDPLHELEAMEMYRYLLAHPAQFGRPATNVNSRAALQHNYASLLHGHQYRFTAGRLWREVYDTTPGDRTIRRAFSLWLANVGAAVEAEQVYRGDPVRWDPALFAGAEDLPPHFVDDTVERWWERPDQAAPRLSNGPAVPPSPPPPVPVARSEDEGDAPAAGGAARPRAKATPRADAAAPPRKRDKSKRVPR